MKNSHRQKMIAPIVITVSLIVFYTIYFKVLMDLTAEKWTVLLWVIPLMIGIGLITVCVKRIKEIEGGEEDDLSQY